MADSRNADPKQTTRPDGPQTIVEVLRYHGWSDVDFKAFPGILPGPTIASTTWWKRLLFMRDIMSHGPKDTSRRKVDVGEQVAAALSNYVVSAFGRRPTQDELNEVYWAAIDAVEKIGEVVTNAE